MGRSQWDPLAHGPTTVVGKLGCKPLSWLLYPGDFNQWIGPDRLTG